MHPNPVFHDRSQEDNQAFARQRAFGVMTLAGPSGPLASHLPFVLSPDGAVAAAHIVRSNPIRRALATPQPALLVVSGPDGYISPDWYGVEDQVPTWNYVAVHLRGVLRLLSDDALRPHLDALSAQNEARLPKAPWTMDKVADEPAARLMRMIIPVELSIDSIEGTWKLNQNKDETVRHRAASMSPTSPMGQENAALAELMRAVTREE